MQRKVYRINKAGSIDDLKLISEELPEPGNEEVTIRVRAIGLNFADIFALTGLYSATPKESFIPGLEYSGTIINTGKNVSNFSTGDNIIGVTRFGAYANFLNIDSKYVSRLPEKWSFEEGASFITQALTAYYALHPLGALKKNQTVLIHSAAGGVGILANRIAKLSNAYTIGTIGDSSKIPLLQKEGYDAWILRSDTFYEDLKKSLGFRELNLVLECIGGKIFEESYRAMGSGGRIVTYGSANFTPETNSPNWPSVIWNYLFRPRLDPLAMTTENKSVMAFNLIWMWERVDELRKLLDEVFSLELPPQLVGKEYPFENAKEALEFFQSGKSVGKIVLTLK